MTDEKELDAAPEAEAEASPGTPVRVRIIKAQGQSALVEWAGPHRAFVPISEIHQETVLSNVLEECPLYGIIWEEYLDLAQIKLACKGLAANLRRAGIWTLEDLQAKDRVVTRIAAKIIGKVVWSAAKRATAKGEQDA